jgi:hypothetical protein
MDFMKGTDTDVCGDATDLKQRISKSDLSDLLVRMKNAAVNLAELASYAEIVGGVSVNRNAIRKWCDVVFDLKRQIADCTNKGRGTVQR